MMRFDHVGILAKDVPSGLQSLQQILGPLECTEVFDDSGLTVSVCFARDAAGMVYEVIAPLGEQSVVTAALRKRSDILNQLAYVSGSMTEDAATLRKSGCAPLGPAKPARAFNAAHVQFFLTPLRFILELIEDNGHQHQFRTIA